MPDPSATPGWVRVPGGAVPVLDIGSAQGRPLVLVPGLSDGLSPVTEPAARALFAAVPLPLDRYRALVLSHPVPVRPGWSTRSLAARLAVALDRLLDRPAVLVAHSLGGMVAQHLAAAVPDRVAGMVLSASTAQADAGLRRVLSRWDRWLIEGAHERFRVDAIRTSVTGGVQREHLALHAAAPHTIPTPAQIARHLTLSAACAGHDALADLERITAVSLVLAGGRDEVVSPRASAELAHCLPNARFEVFDDLGHGFPEQARGPFQARVARFLADLQW